MILDAANTQCPKKKGDILRSDSESKIWAGVVGDAYILLRNTSDANDIFESKNFEFIMLFSSRDISFISSPFLSIMCRRNVISILC